MQWFCSLDPEWMWPKEVAQTVPFTGLVVVGIRLSCQIMESAMGLVMLCSHRWRRDWSDFSRALAGQRYMEAVHCPHNTASLSASLTGSKGMQGNTFGISLAAGVAGRKPPLTSSRLRDSTPDLYSGFISIAFSMNGYNRKAAECRYKWM